MSGRCSNATRQLLSQGRGQFTCNSGNGDSSALKNYKSSPVKRLIPPRRCGYYISFILHFGCMHKPPSLHCACQPSGQCGGHACCLLINYGDTCSSEVLACIFDYVSGAAEHQRLGGLSKVTVNNVKSEKCS